jgi:hypothetical protein
VVAAAVLSWATIGGARNGPGLETPGHRLCDALQRLPEARKAACCGAPGGADMAAACAREIDRSLKAGALTLDAADVDRCAAESASRLEGCDWVTPYSPRVPGSCRGILHGRLDVGMRCRSSLECRDGLHCRGVGTTDSGVCAPPGAPGAACGGGVDTLATYARQTHYDVRHLECAGFCVKGRCAAFAAAGGECSSDLQCAPGSRCASRRCVEGPPPGLGDACAGSTCADELVCVDGRCSHAKKAGEPCAQPSECEATCLTLSRDQPGVCGTKCSAWPPAGYATSDRSRNP